MGSKKNSRALNFLPQSPISEIHPSVTCMHACMQYGRSSDTRLAIPTFTYVRILYIVSSTVWISKEKDWKKMKENGEKTFLLEI